jgi:hypothetical protein
MFKEDGGDGAVSSSVRRARSRRGTLRASRGACGGFAGRRVAGRRLRARFVPLARRFDAVFDPDRFRLAFFEPACRALRPARLAISSPFTRLPTPENSAKIRSGRRLETLTVCR